MRRWLKHTLLCLQALLLSLPGWALDPGWQLARDSDGVKVYTRPVEGSDIKAFRGEVEVEATALQVLGALDDTPAFVEWMHNCIDSKLVHSYSLVDRQQYMVIDFPWPTTDRDMVVRNQIAYNLEKGHVKIDLSAFAEADLPDSARAAMPKSGKRRRVSQMNGFFELQQLGDSRTKVIYQLHMDPAGAVPSGIVNAMIVDNPFNSLQGLRKQAVLEKYRDFDPLNITAQVE